MKCKVCGSENVNVDYDGIIRNGGLGKYTDYPVKMYRCKECRVIWHEPILENESYYETSEYREKLEGTTAEADFYKMHDKDNLDKFTYTGTTIFRNKKVADIGCGAGAFLDFVSGASEEIVAIEPSMVYRNAMAKKGYHTYAYAEDAIKDYKGKIDVVTSFDVIEHVESPWDFLKDIFQLLRVGGVSVIGTPTETPVMRRLLGSDYEKKLLFSTQHLWVFNEDSLLLMAKEAGFKVSNVTFRFFQRYGIGNVFGWLKEKEPRHDVIDNLITDTMDNVWKNELEKNKLSDYIVMYLKK